MNKKIATNYLFSIGYQLLNIILPLVTTPYISRTLGVSNIGYNSYTLSIVNYFTLFAMFGTNIYGQREIGAHQNDRLKCSIIFWEVFSFKVILGIIVSIAYAAMTSLSASEFKILFTIRFFSLLAVILDISWFFQGMENFRITVIRQMAVKILAVVCIFIFVRDTGDLSKYVFIDAFLTFVGAITVFPYLRKYLIRIDWKKVNITSHIKGIIGLFIPQIATSLYAIIDKTMIGFFYRDGIESGYYEQAYKIEMLGICIVVALTNVLIPRLAFYFENGNRENLESTISAANEYIFFIGAPLAAGVSGVCYNLLPWFLGKGYDGAADVLHITAFLIFVMGLTNFWGFGYLVATKQTLRYTLSVSAGTVINIILNYFLIPQNGAIGAAVASISSELIVLIIQIIMVRNQLSIRNIVSGKIRYVFLALIMWVVVTLLSKQLTPSMLHTLVIIVAGMTLYFVPLLVLKDDYLFRIIKSLKNKMKNDRLMGEKHE